MKEAVAKRDVGQPVKDRRGAGPAPAVAAATAAATATPVTCGADAGPGLLLAMAVGGAGDGVLTRDAATIQEYILLMSDQAIGGKEAGGHGDMAAERWRQVGRCGERGCEGDS